MSRSSIRKAAYLSGPMTGIEDYNYPRFHEVAGKMRAQGYAVVNPAESYGGDQSLAFSTYMRWDIKQLLESCDAVVLLGGWQQAAGAVFEVAIAAALGYSILEYQDEPGGFVLKSALPIFETDRERLASVLGLADVKAEEPAPLKVGDRVRYIQGPGFASNARIGKVGTYMGVAPSGIGIGPCAFFRYVSDLGKEVTPSVFLANLERIEDEPKPAALEVVPSGPEPLTSWAVADSELLKEADRIVNSDRQRTYGHPITHHTATAAMWSAYLTRVNDEHEVIVRPQDVSILMVLDKASRIGGGDKVDNALDIAGYAQVHAKVRARQEADNGGVFA